MGMYDYIKFKMLCPSCFKPLEDFQSKDGACCLETLEITEVDNFYTSCDHCRAWIEYRRKEGKKDSGQTLLDAKKIFANIIIDLNRGQVLLAHDIQEGIFAFMKQHPLPENTINDFEMTWQTKQEVDANRKKFDDEFYEKHGKQWYDFVPTNVKPPEDEKD
jgi:hypothetical protein